MFLGWDAQRGRQRNDEERAAVGDVATVEESTEGATLALVVVWIHRLERGRVLGRSWVAALIGSVVGVFVAVGAGGLGDANRLALVPAITGPHPSCQREPRCVAGDRLDAVTGGRRVVGSRHK